MRTIRRYRSQLSGFEVGCTNRKPPAQQARLRITGRTLPSRTLEPRGHPEKRSPAPLNRFTLPPLPKSVLTYLEVFGRTCGDQIVDMTFLQTWDINLPIV